MLHLHNSVLLHRYEYLYINGSQLSISIFITRFLIPVLCLHTQYSFVWSVLSLYMNMCARHVCLLLMHNEVSWITKSSMISIEPTNLEWASHAYCNHLTNLLMNRWDHGARSFWHADLQLCIAHALLLHGFAESLWHPCTSHEPTTCVYSWQLNSCRCVPFHLYSSIIYCSCA